MRALYLSGCSQLTDVAVLEIAYNCQQLNVPQPRIVRARGEGHA